MEVLRSLEDTFDDWLSEASTEHIVHEALRTCAPFHTRFPLGRPPLVDETSVRRIKDELLQLARVQLSYLAPSTTGLLPRGHDLAVAENAPSVRLAGIPSSSLSPRTELLAELNGLLRREHRALEDLIHASRMLRVSPYAIEAMLRLIKLDVAVADVESLLERVVSRSEKRRLRFSDDTEHHEGMTLDTLNPGSSMNCLFTVLSLGQNTLPVQSLRTLLEVVLEMHSGLGFLRDAAGFHESYISTVLYEILWHISPRCSWGNSVVSEKDRHVTRLEFLAMQPSLASVLETIDVSGSDINGVSDFFGYEPYYVLFCKFADIDLNKTGSVTASDLARLDCGSAYSLGSAEKLVSHINQICGKSVLVTNDKSQDLGSQDLDSQGLNSHDLSISYEQFVYLNLSEECKGTKNSSWFFFSLLDDNHDNSVGFSECLPWYSDLTAGLDAAAGGSGDYPKFLDLWCQVVDMASRKVGSTLVPAKVGSTHARFSLGADSMDSLSSVLTLNDTVDPNYFSRASRGAYFMSDNHGSWSLYSVLFNLTKFATFDQREVTSPVLQYTGPQSEQENSSDNDQSDTSVSEGGDSNIRPSATHSLVLKTDWDRYCSREYSRLASEVLVNSAPSDCSD